MTFSLRHILNHLGFEHIRHGSLLIPWRSVARVCIPSSTPLLRVVRLRSQPALLPIISWPSDARTRRWLRRRQVRRGPLAAPWSRRRAPALRAPHADCPPPQPHNPTDGAKNTPGHEPLAAEASRAQAADAARRTATGHAPRSTARGGIRLGTGGFSTGNDESAVRF